MSIEIPIQDSIESPFPDTAGRLSPAMEQTLWAYAHGKPKETTDLTVRVSRMIGQGHAASRFISPDVT
jgi:hypothetical protein